MGKKLSTTRKGFAIGLAVAGIAGLSLASAAQLNLTGSDAGTLQTGVGSLVNADCQTLEIPVTFAVPTRTGAIYTSPSVDLKNISAACDGKSFKYAVLNAKDAVVGSLELTGVVGPAPEGGTTTISIDITALTSVEVDSISQIALTIYS